MVVARLNGISQFLDDYPGMSTAPCRDAGILLRGKFRFKAVVPLGVEIDDSYRLEFFVPEKFPRDLPLIKETDGKIPRNGKFHVNEDSTLCLGSPLRLLIKIYRNPTLSGFTVKCLIPYLYAVSHKIKNGSDFFFGELEHGNQGLIDDYSHLLGLTNHGKVIQAIGALAQKKRIANKRLCPCGCLKRLGVCSFNDKLNKLRKMAPVSWFKAQMMELK